MCVIEQMKMYALNLYYNITFSLYMYSIPENVFILINNWNTLKTLNTEIQK